MPGVSLGMMLATFFAMYGLLVFCLFFKVTRTSIVFFTLLLVWFILGSIGFILSGPIEIESLSYFYNTSKILVWGVIIVFASGKLFDSELFVELVIKISVVTTFYLFVQAVFVYILGINISNGLNLGIITANYSDYYFEQGLGSGQVRLSSIWFEPAQYAVYVLLALICLLFSKRRNVNTLKWYTIFFALGLLISTSTAAIFWLIIILTTKIVWRGNRGVIFSIFVLALFIFIFSNLDMVLNEIKNYGVLGHSLFLAVTKIGHWEDSARLGASYKAAFSILDYGAYKFTGIGFGSENNLLKGLGRELLYLNSFSRVLITTGILGVMAFVLFTVFSILLSRGSKLSVVLLSFCFFSGFYSTMWTSPESILFYSLALYSKKNEL